MDNADHHYSWPCIVSHQLTTEQLHSLYTNLNTGEQVNKVFIKSTKGAVTLRQDSLLNCAEIDGLLYHFVVVRLPATTTTTTTDYNYSVYQTML